MDRGIDRLSALPDAVIHQILSFIDIRSVVRTSILSQRWRHLWESALTVDFDWRIMFPDDFIDRWLALHQGSTVRNFRFSAEHDAYPAQKIDSWIHYLVTHGVEEIELDFLPSLGDEYEGNTERYNVSDYVFNCRSLVALHFRHCKLHLPGSICLPSLKTLHLIMVDFSEDEIKNLLSGSPLLEDLTLQDCNLHTDLNIVAENSGLKRLKISEWDFFVEWGEVTIFAPNLLSLKFHDHMPRLSYVVKNLESLVVADFNFEALMEKEEYSTTHFVEFLEQIHHVKVLKLCSGCVVELSVRELEGSSTSTPFSVLSLDLKTSFCEFELPGLAYILRTFINLEVFSIYIIEEFQSDMFEGLFSDGLAFDKMEQWKSLEISVLEMLRHIKKIKIYGILLGTECATQESDGGVVKDVELKGNSIFLKTREKVVEGILNENEYIIEFLRVLLKNPARVVTITTATKYHTHYANLVFTY